MATLKLVLTLGAAILFGVCVVLLLAVSGQVHLILLLGMIAGLALAVSVLLP